MFVKETLCDKCGGKITENRPDKITLNEAIEKQGNFGRTINTYKVVRTLHLCDKCRKEFDEFMNITGDTEQ